MKKNNILKLRQDKEEIENDFYKPKINQNSLRKRDDIDEYYPSIHERLYIKGRSRDRSKQEKLKLLREEQDKLMTFTPKLYSTCESEKGNIFDFLNRQKSFEDKRREKLSKKSINSQLTFTPDIDPISDYIVKENLKRNSKDKFHRLCKEDFNKMQKKREDLEKFYYSQFNFKPKINNKSIFVGAINSLNELATKKESKKVKEIKRKLKNEETSKDIFQPKMNRDKFEKIQSIYKNNEDIMRNIKEKEIMKYEKVKEIQEYKYHNKNLFHFKQKSK